MTPGFVAAILDGFEATLEALLAHAGDENQRHELAALQAHVAGVRQRFEAADEAEESERTRRVGPGSNPAQDISGRSRNL